MPKKLTWTNAQDAKIKRLRAEGATWDAIAEALRFTRWTVIERGRRIGAHPPPPGFTPQPDDPNRDPLPAGHPKSWGSLVLGSCLEGVRYPTPPETVCFGEHLNPIKEARRSDDALTDL